MPTRDALIVTRLRALARSPCGKTNTPELGAGSQTFNEVFGATRNPYDLTKTCGGSSGGAAVALACGMVPIADGSDTGGSLRNPASVLQRGRAASVAGPRAGRRRFAGRRCRCPGRWRGRSRDVALLLSAIAGPDPRSPLAIAEDGARFRAPLDRNFKGVRVAWWKGLGGIPFEPEIRSVVDANRRVFESLGLHRRRGRAGLRRRRTRRFRCCGSPQITRSTRRSSASGRNG